MSKNKISLQQAHNQWLELVTETGMDRHDHPAMAESWNNYVDALEKDGQLYALQARYAPAWDEQMPGNGSQWDPLRDDREHVLESLGITMDCRFVPFSQSRNAGSKDRSLNWKVTFKRDGKPMLKEFDYQMSIGYCDPVEAPYASHVFNDLLLDSVALQCRDFAEWADNYGYDSESVKAKELYDAHMRRSLELHAVLGSARMDALRDLFEEM